MRARRLAAILVALALAGCATAPGGPGRRVRLAANPSAIVAVELALARAAQEQGQWAAASDYAAPTATVFVPQPVPARDWLKKQTNPAEALRRQPHEIWSSCDGTLAIAQGAWQQSDGAFGVFATVWERQPDGAYKWVVGTKTPLAEPLSPPEMIRAHVANCTAAEKAAIGDTAGWARSGSSRDKTLAWRIAVDAEGNQDFRADIMEGGQMVPVRGSEDAPGR